MPAQVIVHQVKVDQILALRRAVLLADRPPEAARFPGDDADGNVHFAATAEDAVVGCATLHREPFNRMPAWRLRGMAVDETLRGGGVGRLLLEAVDDYARDVAHARLLWCNARLVFL